MHQLTPIGKVTVFYIPSHKLDSPRYGNRGSARDEIHAFLIAHYKAYTHTPSPVKGYWISGSGELLHDVTERFEVSFGSEKDFALLVEFLATVCATIDEESIYLTRGDESFLVGR
jgi:hypothetical protein